MIKRRWKLSLWLVAIGALCGRLIIAQPPAKPSYYDTRERVAAVLTFEWQETQQVKVPPQLVRALNEMKLQRAQSSDAPPEAGKPIAEEVANAVFELSAYYTIERTPQRTCLRTQGQGVHLEQAKATDFLLSTETYFVGGTVIAVHRDYSSGRIASVDIAKGEDDVLGMGSPFGSLPPEWLVVYGGVSPFRLYGFKPENWRLISVSPEEWLFELSHQSQENAPKTRLHLNRHYQDALSRLEVHYPDGEVWTWRVLKYKRIEGIWFPSEVEFTVQGGRGYAGWARAVLVRSERTKSVELQIPEKTHVRDWRHLGRQVWDGASKGYKQTEWSEEFEKLLQPSSLPSNQRSKEPSASSNPKR